MGGLIVPVACRAATALLLVPGVAATLAVPLSRRCKPALDALDAVRAAHPCNYTALGLNPTVAEAEILLCRGECGSTLIPFARDCTTQEHTSLGLSTAMMAMVTEACNVTYQYHASVGVSAASRGAPLLGIASAAAVVILILAAMRMEP